VVFPSRWESTCFSAVSKPYYLHREEMIEERGLPVNHVTIWRWVLHYARILNQRMLPELRHPIGPWQADETYVALTAVDYLYRAVDSTGETIDFVLLRTAI
jgi:IS6 family transposase